MSLSQIIKLCFCIDGIGQRHESVGGLRPQESPKDKCETAIAKLCNVVDESRRIHSETATASKLLQASSEAVVNCLTCPRGREDDSRFGREDLP